MINNKIGGHNMVGRAVNRLAGRLTAVVLTAEYRDGSKEGVQAFCYGADECEK